MAWCCNHSLTTECMNNTQLHTDLITSWHIESILSVFLLTFISHSLFYWHCSLYMTILCSQGLSHLFLFVACSDGDSGINLLLHSFWVTSKINVRSVKVTELYFNWHRHLAQRNICLSIKNSCRASQRSCSTVAYCGGGYHDESHQLEGSWQACSISLSC